MGASEPALIHTPPEPHLTWRARYATSVRWLVGWLEARGVDAAAVLWPDGNGEDERAVVRVAERRPVSDDERRRVEAWFVTARKKLRKVLALRGVPRELQEEVLQKTLLRAVEALGRFKPDRADVEASLHAWIAGIARHVLQETWRGPTRREVPCEEVDAGSYEVDPAKARLLEQIGPPLFDAVDALPDVQRAAWLALDVELARPSRYARALGENENSVRSDSRLAREKIQKALRPWIKDR